MTSNKYIKYASILTLISGFALLAQQVSAADMNQNEKILNKVSKEGLIAMREIRWARVAMFDGNVEQAGDLLKKSRQYLTQVEKQAPELVVTVKTSEKVDGKAVRNEKETVTHDLVPIDAGLTLAEDFVSTPEKQEKIKKANKHLHNKETSKAIQVLKEADIGVSVSRVLMPVKDTIKHVDKAIELVGKHQYYQANLALKAAEDGLIVDSVLLYEPVTNDSKK